MAKKKVEAPDGSKMVVDAPDDASDDEVIEFAAEQLKARARDKERKELIDMINAQAGEVEKLREDVLNMGKLLLKMAERVPPAPSIKVNPEVKVMADPSIAAAILAVQQSNEDIMKRMVTELATHGQVVVKTKLHEDNGLMFDIIHNTDRHSPLYGRLSRVVVTKKEN